MDIVKPELLAPAGSMEAVYSAVSNGCDALYLGGKSFGARQYAANFDIEEIKEICDYCHLRGVKTHITVNTLYKETEIENVLNFAAKLYEAGADALITQDLGAAALIKQNIPDMELHASTQLTANNAADVKRLAEAGFSRVVLSRELSLDEIKSIIEETGVNVETFVHGALCVCYSGQCLMSSMLGGRSGNRGRCAQTCRLPFSLINRIEKVAEGHLLSPKDMETVSILPRLIQAGISSFKIEGRMKSPEYVGGVTAVYRKYIDKYFDDPENYAVDKEDIKILTRLFNRGGFNNGYYNQHSGADMMSVERPKSWGLKAGIIDSYDPKHKKAVIRTREPFIPGDGIEIWTQKEPHVGMNITKKSKAGEYITVTIDGDINKNDVVYKTHDKALYDNLKNVWERNARKRPAFGKLTAKKGEPMRFELWTNDGAYAFCEGGVVEKAQKQPMTKDRLLAQASKFGATPFELTQAEIDCDDDIYVGISEINDLRRKTAEKLEQSILKAYNRKAEIKERAAKSKPKIIRKKALSALVTTADQFFTILNIPEYDRIYFELTTDIEKRFDALMDKAYETGAEIYAALPRIDRAHTEKLFGDFYEKIGESPAVKGFLIRSAGQAELCEKYNKKIAADFNLNTFNSETERIWKNDFNAETVCLSPELNLKEINAAGDENAEMIVYGYIPLMTTHQCPIGNFDGEKNGSMFCKARNTEELYYLKDRKGVTFPILTDCRQCVCQILNSKPIYTLKFFDEIMESVTGMARVSFTRENVALTKTVAEAYAEAVKYGVGRKAKALTARLDGRNITTKGHFFRGVE